MKAAVFSECRTWRYQLTRAWDGSLPWVMFVGLNPSKADETEDDMTIRVCMGYARRWGFGGILMANLFAFCATYPVDLFVADDPVGPETDHYLGLQSALTVADGGVVVACWGVDGDWRDRSAQVAPRLGQYKALALTKNGQPRHPRALSSRLRPADPRCLAVLA